MRRIEILCELRALTPAAWDALVAYAMQRQAYGAAWRAANPENVREQWRRRKADAVRYGAKKRQNAERMLAKYHALGSDEKRARNSANYAGRMRRKLANGRT